ncbi:uncharacterized protein, partial [Heptranchias perlo]|uniref:uncharacterized protein n=1 Tax=Heptranchias perlo TaxID=212740 RepID=UPI00355AB055
IAYYGAASQILEFFSGLGLHCSPHYNPADFILDKIKQSPEVREKIVTSANALRKTSSECPLDSQYFASVGADDEIPNGLTVNKHREITGPRQSENNSQSHGPKQGKSWTFDDDQEVRWTSSFWTQYSTLTARNFKQQRGVILSWLNLIQTLIMALVPGAIFWQLPKVEEQIRAIAGLLFFLLVYWGFTPMLQAVSLFPAERPIINKERLSGCYRLSAYYLAKMTSELPLTIIQPAVSLTIAYWMAGLNGVGAYFVDVGLIMLTAVTAQSIGLFSSALFLRINQSIIFATIFMLISLLLGGFYIQNLPRWLTWAQYLSFISYPFHVMLRMEFDNNHEILCKARNSAFRHCNVVRNTSNTTAYVPRDDILASYNDNLPIYASILILLLFLLAFRLACYLVLRFFRRP